MRKFVLPHTNFSGKFEEIWTKIVRTPKNVPAPAAVFAIGILSDVY